MKKQRRLPILLVTLEGLLIFGGLFLFELVAFWVRNEARGIVILCEQRVTKPKTPPNEPAGQRLAALSAALVLVCVE